MTTRFYDPQKEAMHEREERVKRELGLNEEGEKVYRGEGIRGQFRNASHRGSSKTVADARKKSNLRLLYILIILAALFYFFLK